MRKHRQTPFPASDGHRERHGRRRAGTVVSAGGLGLRDRPASDRSRDRRVLDRAEARASCGGPEQGRGDVRRRCRAGTRCTAENNTGKARPANSTGTDGPRSSPEAGRIRSEGMSRPGEKLRREGKEACVFSWRLPLRVCAYRQNVPRPCPPWPQPCSRMLSGTASAMRGLPAVDSFIVFRGGRFRQAWDAS